METKFLWKSFPRPCKKIVIRSLKLKKEIWNIRPVRKFSIPIIRIMKEYQTNIKTKLPIMSTIERFIQSETTGSIIHLIFGDDPYLYLQYGVSMNILAVRLLFQTILRDMYIIRLVENIVYLQHAFTSLGIVDKIVHTVLPIILTIIHIVYNK